MDNNQKREIVRMRLCGMGYRTIANEVGLSRDIVRIIVIFERLVIRFCVIFS